MDANTTNLGEQIGGVVGAVGDAATSVAGSAVGAGIQWVIDWIQEAMADVAVSVASFWTSTPTVSVGSVDGSASPTVGWIQDALRNYTVILAVISLVFGGVYLAIKGRVTLPQLGMFLFRIAAAGALTTAVCAALIGAADDFSEWIIPAASNGSDLGANLAALFANPITGPVGLVCLDPRAAVQPVPGGDDVGPLRDARPAGRDGRPGRGDVVADLLRPARQGDRRPGPGQTARRADLRRRVPAARQRRRRPRASPRPSSAP